MRIFPPYGWYKVVFRTDGLADIVWDSTQVGQSARLFYNLAKLYEGVAQILKSDSDYGVEGLDI
jgi:hypothetical protein